MWPDLDPDSMAAYYMEQGVTAMLSGDEEEMPVECRYCHRRAFFWENTDKGWRLTTIAGRIHSCSAYTKEKSK